MSIRAKFRCTQVKRIQSCNPDGTYPQVSEEVQLLAVYGDVNAKWAKWTPSGSITMLINNPDTQGKFKPEQCYYLDFIEAPETDE